MYVNRHVAYRYCGRRKKGYALHFYVNLYYEVSTFKLIFVFVRLISFYCSPIFMHDYANVRDTFIVFLKAAFQFRVFHTCVHARKR